MEGYIFDLDGVLVDTAKHHYEAWKAIARELGLDLTPAHNEALKGIGREDSLRRILEWAGKDCSPEVFQELALRKNAFFLEQVRHIDASELLPGVKEFLEALKAKGKKIALGSASRNARMVLERTGIVGFFDTIVDGTMVSKAKPNPEVFLKAAEGLELPSSVCCVFEDASAGIQAAKSAGMMAIGIGSKEVLPQADRWLTGFVPLPEELFL